jgi:hypothetical protein
MARPSKLTITQKQQVVKLYLEEKMSTNKISKLFMVNAETIRNVLIEFNILRRTIAESKIISTKFTFKEMTKEKAFLLGLIYGDGSISKKKDYFNITTGDKDLLIKSSNILGVKFKIYDKSNKCWSGVFCSHKICNELSELFKLVNNKSDKLVFPRLDNVFLPAFISGYLATDGCISINKADNILTLSFYSCSKDYLSDLNKYLCNAIDIPVRTIYERKKIKGHLGKKTLYTLVFNGKKAEKACKFIFQDNHENLRSDRKYLTYTSFINNKPNMQLSISSP